MARHHALRSWLLLATGCGFMLGALLRRPPLHRELILFGVVVLMLAASSFLEPHTRARPPPSE